MRRFDDGERLVEGTPIPEFNDQPLSQTYPTGLVQGPKLHLGSYQGAGGDAGQGLPTKFHYADLDLATLADGWHRLTVVCDGTKSDFYVDSALRGTGLASKTDVYAVGNQPLGHHRFGALAGFALYDFAVDPTQLPDW